MHTNPTTRREFIKHSSTAVAGAALTAALASPRAGYCAEDNAIKVALVGCGGRGTGAAANALATKGPTKLWAVADVFPNKAESAVQSLSAKYASPGSRLESMHLRHRRGFDSSAA
jgi:hypothetical protein